MKLQFTIYNTICYDHKRCEYTLKCTGFAKFFFFPVFLPKNGFYVDSNFSTFTLQRFTNVQLYSQKYVPLLGYIIDTDQTSKQENTTNFYICKVYTKYTLYIYRSKTKAELDFLFFLMLNNQIVSLQVNSGVGIKNPKNPPLLDHLWVFSQNAS